MDNIRELEYSSKKLTKNTRFIQNNISNLDNFYPMIFTTLFVVSIKTRKQTLFQV